MSDDDTPILTGPPLAGDEITTLAGSLEAMRRTFIWKAGGLDAAGLQARLGPSTMTLGGMLKHLAHVEDVWFNWNLRGRSPGLPWDAVDWDTHPEWPWTSAAEDTPEELYALWEQAVLRSRTTLAEVLHHGDLGQPGAFTTPEGESPSVRYILAVLLMEYSRHTGHADLLRESVDGLVGEDPPC